MIAALDRLHALTLLYLAAPALVFCLGWLEPLPGIALAVLLLTALLPLLRPRAEFDNLSARSPGALVWLGILAALWTALSGAGHFVYANPDWHTRDAVYADLFFTSWPPAYGYGADTDLILRSATGYFLPPAAATKLAGLGFARWLLYLWTAIGAFLFLVLLPLPQQFGSRMLILSLAAVLFSGMDYPAILLVHGHAPIFPAPLEWWRPWTYTSLAAQLFWAPNHALALWLGTLLLWRLRDDNSLSRVIVLLFPLLLLWTPFAIGLLPWAVWLITRRRSQIRELIRQPTIVDWLAAAALGGVLLAYLTRPGVEPTAFAMGISASAGASAAHSWSWIDTAIAYIQFAAFEFGILAMLLRPGNLQSRQALALAVTILLILPVIRIGPSNDLMLRASTPCLIMLLVFSLMELDRPAIELVRSWRTVTLIIVLATGAITPAFEVARALLRTPLPPNYGQTLVEAQGGYLAPHYLAKLDQRWLGMIFRTPALVPSGSNRILP